MIIGLVLACMSMSAAAVTAQSDVPDATAAQTAAVTAHHVAIAPGRRLTVGLQADKAIAISADLFIVLPRLVEDALYQGVPMYFVQEAEVLQDRWYWTAKQMVQTRRYLRLSYQPLTRRWRLAQSNEAFNSGGLGSALAQNFDSLQDAIAVMQRISHWRIAAPGVLELGQDYTLNLSFRLDLSQLPRPLQIGAIGQSDWNVSQSLQHTFVLREARP